MKKTVTDVSLEDESLETLLMHFNVDRYKMAYLSLRWAKEMKQKENLSDALPTLVPRALREILTGKVSMKEIEKLPVITKVVAPIVAAPVAPSLPTLTLKKSKDDEEEEADEE